MLDNPKKTFMIDTHKANSSQEYFAACPKGLENLLLQELTALGAVDVRETVAGVYFSGETRLLYKTCLWSRLANKILLPLANFSVKDEQSLNWPVVNTMFLHLLDLSWLHCKHLASSK